MSARSNHSRGQARPKPLGHTAVIWFLLVVAAASTLVIGPLLFWFQSLHLPDPLSTDGPQGQAGITLLDRQGRAFDSLPRVNRLQIDLDSLPPWLPQAFVAAEDGRFFEHGGIDTFSILRALLHNLQSGGRDQGGSTITQQVARLYYLDREKTYGRKSREALLAAWLETRLDKRKILELYLNAVYLGAGAHGVEAAARTYFNKGARDLDLAESSLLAGLPQAPSRYAPTHDMEAAKERQRYVLNRMAEDGFIDAAQARAAHAQQLSLKAGLNTEADFRYFSDYVVAGLEAGAGERPLRVHTSLDPDLQAAAARAVREGCALVAERQQGPPPQGALVALDNRSGAIRAMVGGTDFNQSQFNRATSAQRQPGSVFKTLIWAAALENSIPLDTQILDGPLNISNPDGSVWRPRNYDDRFLGPIDLREALIQSRNLVAVRLLKRVGTGKVIALARELGISSPLAPELPLALGGSGVLLLEMTAAYATLAGQGLYRPPWAVVEIRDRLGRVTRHGAGPARQVLTAATSTQLSAVLAEVVERGTGRAARGIAGAAGKTGTSDDNVDAWFIGFTPALTTGVWLGHDYGRSLGRGETGGRAAAPVWQRFMREAQAAR